MKTSKAPATIPGSDSGSVTRQNARQGPAPKSCAASINAGTHYAMAQAAHGSAPDIAGQNIANPFSQVCSAAMLLTWYGQRKGRPEFVQASEALEQAVTQAIAAKESTRDMGGKLGTKEAGQALLKRLAA
jgi:3-isopropylmalate dehydrogenase